MENYKATTVGELLRELATLPPMLEIIGQFGVPNNFYYFNGITLTEFGDNKTLVLVLCISDNPESKQTIFEPSQEEQEAEKREKALQMGREKKQAEEI